MLKVLQAIFAFLLLIGNTSPLYSQDQMDELPECVLVTHCVRVNWETKDVEKTFIKTADAIANTPRTKIVEQTDSYIHAEAKTKWLKYTDDLLVKSLPKKGLVQVRSESRVGIGDNGVNKKRVDELAYRVMTNQP